MFDTLQTQWYQRQKQGRSLIRPSRDLIRGCYTGWTDSHPVRCTSDSRNLRSTVNAMPRHDRQHALFAMARARSLPCLKPLQIGGPETSELG